jgi:hypothetical protein
MGTLDGVVGMNSRVLTTRGIHTTVNINDELTALWTAHGGVECTSKMEKELFWWISLIKFVHELCLTSNAKYG